MASASGQSAGGNVISSFETSQDQTISMEEGTTLLASTPGDLSASETMNNLQKEAFQLANYYFVFQGVIFTAFFSTPSNLKCEYRWVPFTLSFLAGILNLFALLTMALKYKSLLDDRDCKATDGQPAPSGMRVSPAANRHGPSHEREGGSSSPIIVSCIGNWRKLYVMGCMGVFAGFFVVTLVGCMKFNCAHN